MHVLILLCWKDNGLDNQIVNLNFFLNSSSFSKNIYGSGLIIWDITLFFLLIVWKYTFDGLPSLPARPDNWWYSCTVFSTLLMSKPREAKSKSSITMQFKFGKWKPFDINWVPIKILVSLSIILWISICEFFLFIVCNITN